MISKEISKKNALNDKKVLAFKKKVDQTYLFVRK